MSLPSLYESELRTLRETGKAFAERHPKLAPFLASPSRDPDVERLLEGFAFLNARLWQKVEDELPEVTYDFFNVLYPHYLRSLPACSILAYEPSAGFDELGRRIARGSELQVKKAGKPYFFRTCYALTVQPFTLKSIRSQAESEKQTVHLHFELTEGMQANKLKLTQIPFYLGGDLQSAFLLYEALLNQPLTVKLQVGRQQLTLPEACFKGRGFSESETLLPSANANFPVMSLLQEFYAFPEKFLFVELQNLPCFEALEAATEFTLSIEIETAVESPLLVNDESFKLHCTPIVNLYQTDAVPIVRNHETMHYALTPEAQLEQDAAVFSIVSVRGFAEDQQQHRRYHPLERYLSPTPNEPVYQWQVRPGVLEKAPRYYLDFPSHDAAEVSLSEIISTEIEAYQPTVFRELERGEINNLRERSNSLHYANITRLSAPVYPPLEKSTLWQLISNLALDFQRIDQGDNLKNMLSLYHFAAPENLKALHATRKLVAALKKVLTQPKERLLKGQIVRGFTTHIALHETPFLNRGELYLFGCVLNTIFQAHAPINGFHEITLDGLDSGVAFQWPTTFV